MKTLKELRCSFKKNTLCWSPSARMVELPWSSHLKKIRIKHSSQCEGSTYSIPPETHGKEKTTWQSWPGPQAMESPHNPPSSFLLADWTGPSLSRSCHTLYIQNDVARWWIYCCGQPLQKSVAGHLSPPLEQRCGQGCRTTTMVCCQSSIKKKLLLVSKVAFSESHHFTWHKVWGSWSMQPLFDPPPFLLSYDAPPTGAKIRIGEYFSFGMKIWRSSP